MRVEATEAILDDVRLITPLRELNKVPGAVEIGPLKRGLLRRQAGIPQGRHQGNLSSISPSNTVLEPPHYTIMVHSNSYPSTR